jgi:hypothetical protein
MEDVGVSLAPYSSKSMAPKLEKRFVSRVWHKCTQKYTELQNAL